MPNFAEQLQQQKAVKNTPFWLCTALLLCAVFIAVIQSQSRNYFDDAYMFVRYADHLLQGFGHSWNIGEIAIYGSTSIFYVLQVALIRALGVFNATETVVLLSSFWALAAVAVLAKTCSVLLCLASFSKSFSLLLLALMFCSPFLYHANTGMDTTLSLFFISLLIYCSLSSGVNPNFYKTLVLAVVAFLAIAARPDNAIVALALPCLMLLSFVKRPWCHIGLFVGVAFLLIALDLWLKNMLLHDPLPLAFYAKRSGFYQGYKGHFMWNPVSYLLMFLVSGLPYVVFWRKPEKHTAYKLAGVFLLPLGLTLAYYFTVVQVMGHLARYYFPFLPLLMVYCLTTLALYQSQSTQKIDKKRSLKQLFYAVVLLVLALPLPALYEQYLQPASTPYKSQTTKPSARETNLPLLPRWQVITELAKFAQSLPEGTRFAMSEYGYIGAKASGLHIIDLLGLHDRYIAHRGFSADYVLAQKPDVIWLAHSHYSRINGLIIDHHEFQKHYQFYPGAFIYGFAIRKDSPKAVQQKFDKLWQQFYPSDKNAYLIQWPSSQPKNDL